MTNNKYYIIELSSYQIDYSKSLKLDSACILNISPDHLERHGTFSDYKRIKFKIFNFLKEKKVGFYSKKISNKLIGLECDDQNNIENGYYNGREMIVGKLPSIYFGFDSASIPATERIKLQEAANYLANNPSENLLIEGRSDWYGTADYNIALSDRRANSALDYLNTLGADSSRIETLSKGSLEATSGLSKTQASQDRRADLILLK